ncbi:U-box domain-containing protein 9 [Lolium perenne]|uniref:U-box domain-containing protein 9 n=1 Tax=Lolium perenne TaxID=4522 RepID=UPI0021EB5151|nr:U-box domain-containing protein 4 [Lolium perenne]
MDSPGPCGDQLLASPAAAERPSELAALRALVDRVRKGEVEAAREVRRLTRASARHRRKLAAAVEPLVAMLRSGAPDAGEAALLALLNLAVRDERNKIKILDAGALEPLLDYLQSSDLNLQEYATAAILTLSASSTNKPLISASGAIPLLVKVLKEGNPQAKNDAVMALYNLSTIADNLQAILSVQPIPPLIELMRGGKRSSKTVDKCCALLESLLAFDQGRVALTSEEGGVLTIVEVLEEGSLQGREHAVGALLTMCESDRSKYRDPILNEGVIPGLLELTAHGTPKSRVKAHALLDLLRNSPYSRSKMQPNTLENIVSNIASQIDGEDRGGKAKKMLAEMVKVSMEQSLRHLQRRASFA